MPPDVRVKLRQLIADEAAICNNRLTAPLSFPRLGGVG